MCRYSNEIVQKVHGGILACTFSKDTFLLLHAALCKFTRKPSKQVCRAIPVGMLSETGTLKGVRAIPWKKTPETGTLKGVRAISEGKTPETGTRIEARIEAQHRALH